MCVLIFEMRSQAVRLKELFEEVIRSHGGVAKTADFLSAGIRADEVAALCNKGYITRIKHGYYELSPECDVPEEKLLSVFIPEAILCVESALYHYGYSDFAPRKWTIAVPRTISRTKLSGSVLAIQTYYVEPNLYEFGRQTEHINGVTLPIYDRERTICDCFKYRNRLDSEIFAKALNAYVRDSGKNLKKLSEYAKVLRVSKGLTEIMEVLLNG